MFSSDEMEEMRRESSAGSRAAGASATGSASASQPPASTPWQPIGGNSMDWMGSWMGRYGGQQPARPDFSQALRGEATYGQAPYSHMRSPGLESLISYLNSYYSGQSGQPGGMGYFGWPSQGGDPRGMRYPEPAFEGAPYGRSGFGGNDPFFSHWNRQNSGARRQAAPGEEEEAPWDPVAAGFPEAFRDPRFQEIANRYAAVSEDWRDGGRHWDRASLARATQEALRGFDVKTAQELEGEVAQWGVEGLTGRQWLDDLNWMAEHLGLDQGRYSGWKEHAADYQDTRGIYGQRSIPHTFRELQDNPVFKTIAEKYVALDPRWRNMGRDWNVEDLANWAVGQIDHVRKSGKANLEKEAEGLGIRDFDADMWQEDMEWLYKALMPSLNDARNAYFAERGVDMTHPLAQQKILEVYRQGSDHPDWMKYYPINRGYDRLLQETPMYNPVIDPDYYQVLNQSRPGPGFGLQFAY